MMWKFSLMATIASTAVLLLSHCNKVEESSEGQQVVSYTKQVESWEYGKQAYDHAEAIVAFGPRPAESQELELTRQYIQTELKKRGWLVKRQAFTAQTPEGKKQFVNLYARYMSEGKTPDQVWKAKHHAVVGAHIDTKKIPGMNYLGAVDAAGAVGSLIEMADFLAKHQPEKAQLLELVFFDGEEAIKKRIHYGQTHQRDGLYGSDYYAKNRNRQRKFGIILDLIGHKNQVIKVPSDSPEKLVKSMKKAAALHGVKSKFQMSNMPIVDDHVPLNFYGTPTIDLIGEFSPDDGWWHQKGDTMEQLSAKQLGVTIKVALDMIAIEFAK